MIGRHTAVGLDIGRYSVKAVWLKKTGSSFTVTRTELFKFSQGDKFDPVPVSQWIDKIGLRNVPCVLGISARDTIFQPLQMIPADPRTIEQFAAMEVVRFNELAAGSMLFDHVPFTVTQNDRRFLLAIVPPSVIADLMNTAHAIGIQVADIIPFSSAIFGLLQNDPASASNVTAFVDVGHSSTVVAFGRLNNLMFIRAFPIGGAHFTAAILDKSQYSQSQADAVKITDASLKDGNVHAAKLQTACETWLTELVSCFSVFSNLLPNASVKPSRIVLSGGGALLSSFREVVAARTRLPVVNAPDLPGLPKETAIVYTGAAGLAAAALDESNPCRLSLLPELEKTMLILRSNRKWWITAAAAAGFILVASLIGGFADFKRNESVLRIQMAELNSRQALVSQIDSSKLKSDTIRKMSKPLNKLVQSGTALRRLVRLLAELKQETESITLISDSESYASPATLAAGAARVKTDRARPRSPAPAPGGTNSVVESLIIEGFTRDASLRNVKALISALNAADFIKSADLLSDDKMAPLDTSTDNPVREDAARFAVEIVLKESF
jgi:Tfp pilus assembly PilM family ATPase